MKAFTTLLKIELKLQIREFSGVLFGIFIPIALMGLLGILYQNSEKIQLAVPAVLTIGICATGLMGIPVTLSGYREKKILRRFQVTPTSPILLLMVQFAASFLMALLSSIGVVAVAKLFFNYELKGSLFSFIMLYLLLVFSIYAIGLLIASISSTVTMSNTLCSLAYFPMFLLSGATIPYEIMPRPLQLFSNIFPLTHGIKILKGISIGQSIHHYTWSLMILLLVGLLCMMVSVKVFKYDYR